MKKLTSSQKTVLEFLSYGPGSIVDLALALHPSYALPDGGVETIGLKVAKTTCASLVRHDLIEKYNGYNGDHYRLKGK